MSQLLTDSRKAELSLKAGGTTVLCAVVTPLNIDDWIFGGTVHSIEYQARCFLHKSLRAEILKFFNYVRGRAAAGQGAYGKWLGDSKLMNGLIWDCNLEKRAWDSGLARTIYPESIMKQNQYRGYAVVDKIHTTNLTAYDIQMVLRSMLYNEREQLLLAYPKLSRVGCSSFNRNFTQGRKHLKIACIFDTKPPVDFKIDEPKDELEENYCKSDNDCIYTLGSKCFEKLCYVPPRIYVNGH